MKYELIEHHRNITDAELINDLKKVSTILSTKSVTTRQYTKYGQYGVTTLTKHFGSWENCLTIAGLNLSRSRYNVSEEELFENLENVWISLGRQPKYSELKTPLSKFSVGTYERRYGTLFNALRAFIDYIDGSVITEKPNIIKTENPRNINLRTRFKVMQRDNFKCRICGASPATNSSVVLHIDHITPCSNGGTSDFSNLQTLCSKCNLGKSDLLM